MTQTAIQGALPLDEGSLRVFRAYLTIVLNHIDGYSPAACAGGRGFMRRFVLSAWVTGFCPRPDNLLTLNEVTDKHYGQRIDDYPEGFPRPKAKSDVWLKSEGKRDKAAFRSRANKLYDLLLEVAALLKADPPRKDYWRNEVYFGLDLSRLSVAIDALQSPQRAPPVRAPDTRSSWSANGNGVPLLRGHWKYKCTPANGKPYGGTFEVLQDEGSTRWSLTGTREWISGVNDQGAPIARLIAPRIWHTIWALICDPDDDYQVRFDYVINDQSANVSGYGRGRFKVIDHANQALEMVGEYYQLAPSDPLCGTFEFKRIELADNSAWHFPAG